MVLPNLSIKKMLLFMQMWHHMVMFLYVILNAQLVALHDIIFPTKTNNESKWIMITTKKMLCIIWLIAIL